MNKSIIIILFVITFLSVSINIFGQTTVFLNNKKVDLINKVYLNFARIDSCFYVKDGSIKKEFHILTKGQKFNYFTLSYILKQYTGISNSKSPVLFKINGRIIEDTTNVQIDDTYPIYVKTVNLSNVKYISRKMRNFTIVRINLGTKEKEPDIYIKGNQELIDKIK